MKPTRYFFISGLPRSGSTLLGALLRQNPNVTAGMSSPLYSLVSGLLPQLSNASEFNIFIDDAARTRLLRGLFENFYQGTNAVVMDTNRHWTSKINLLLTLFPETRFVCCVRPIPEIVQSFERVFAARPAEISKMVRFDPETNVYSRTDVLMSGGGVVGFPLNALKEAFFGQHGDRLMLVSYANLAARPREVMDGIYDFLGLERHAHDFEKIKFEVDDYDRSMGFPGMHKVRPKVQAEPRALTLPPDLVARLSGPWFWENPPPGSKSHTAFARNDHKPAPAKPPAKFS
ncbi:MAG: sulfotransferase [Methylobacillus sp.]|jgi:sulfotransferase|nr:sulfotransferase [Methylobacillus sp.]